MHFACGMYNYSLCHPLNLVNNKVLSTNFPHYSLQQNACFYEAGKRYRGNDENLTGGLFSNSTCVPVVMMSCIDSSRKILGRCSVVTNKRTNTSPLSHTLPEIGFLLHHSSQHQSLYCFVQDSLYCRNRCLLAQWGVEKKKSQAPLLLRNRVGSNAQHKKLTGPFCSQPWHHAILNKMKTQEEPARMVCACIQKQDQTINKYPNMLASQPA